MGAEQHVLDGSTQRDQTLQRRRVGLARAEAGNRHQQQGRPVGFVTGSLDLFGRGVWIPVKQCERENLGQQVPQLRRDGHEAPGRELSMVGCSRGKVQQGVAFCARRARVVESLGRYVLSGRDQGLGRLVDVAVNAGGPRHDKQPATV